MTDLIKNQIDLLPNLPGCYLMHDEKDEIIYIGKAKNLKNRVSQYFLNEHTGKTKAMVSHVKYFETIITQSEKEALILEMNLIQKNHPKYNIMLMDDKHYPYIELHTNIKDPYIGIARRLKNKKSKYYGPYPNSRSAFEVIDIINSLFPLRKCKNVGKSSCLYYHMHECLAPCINEVKKEDYDKIIDEINNILKGNNEELIKKIKDKINYYSSNLDFENALTYKNKLDSLLYINEKQNVEFFDNIDRDFIAFYISDNYVSINILIYRKGLLIGKKDFNYEIVGDNNEFILNILLQYYLSIPLPSEIITSSLFIKEELENNLDTKIILTQGGKYLEIINNSVLNAKENLSNFFHYKSLKKDNEYLLNELASLLKIDYPRVIELFDNSHLQGTNAIGAMVTYINGEENKKYNRVFNINSINKKDDLSSMKEVLTRRYSRLKEEKSNFPSLIILDGGKNQIEVANNVFKELNINIPLCGLVKDDKHRTKALMNSSLEEIPLNDNELFLFLTKMQDSIHRFAISTHIKKRSKNMFKSIFDDINGIGEKRKEDLLKAYPTLEDLKKATLIELEQILPDNVALTLYNKLREDNE